MLNVLILDFLEKNILISAEVDLLELFNKMRNHSDEGRELTTRKSGFAGFWL